MALSDEAQARAFGQALAHIQAERVADAARGRPNAGIGVSRITRAIYESVPAEYRGAYSSYAAVVRRAVASDMLARSLNSNPDRRPGVRDVPIVPTLFDNSRRYQYDVVSSYQSSSGRIISVRGRVNSDSLLTSSEIAERVASRMDYTESGSRTNRRAARTLPAGAVPMGVTILSIIRVD